MTVFSKVVTGVKRRIPASDAASTTTSEASRTNEDSRPVAPDLRRFSDFMNPFPNVSPGGYTKYYKAKGEEPGSASQYALPSLCELNQRPPAPRRPPPIQTSGLASKPRPSRQATHHPSSTVTTLTSIPESASEHHRSQRWGTPSQELSPHASLRRRKRRLLLRTPSVERDFAQQNHLLDTPESQSASLNRAASTSSSQSSSSTYGSRSTHGHSSDSSTDSHNSSDLSPLTPLDNLPSPPPPPSAYSFNKDPYQYRKKLDMGDWEPFERPDSRSTYRTARTHFDDI